MLSHLVHDRVCVSGIAAQAIVAAVAAAPADIAARARRGGSISLPTLDRRGGCTTSPETERAGAIPASLGVSLNEVAAFQSTHVTALRVGDPNVDVHLYAYGTKYAVVALSRVHGAPTQLGCSNEASYRVTLSSGTVFPFDGCVEAHTRTLPTFSELPPN